MKLLLLATAFLLAVSATPIDEWNQYKAEHNKVYTSKKENDRRLEQYLKNKEMVEEHNRKYERGETTYTMGINHFSDWFPEEIDKMLGQRLDKNRPQRSQKFGLPPRIPTSDTINWVKKGAVTKVKIQGKCVSGYAFAAVGALEGLMFRTNKTITDLSVQQIVDCSFDDGCLGGWPEDCFEYVKHFGGIEKDETYPYVGKEQQCRDHTGTKVATCTGYKIITDETDLTRYVSKTGPVAIGFNVQKSFMQYKSGIYEEKNCGKYLNHGMLAVGYGKDNVTNQEYWLIKNSWGTKWGEEGFARVIKNVDMCGLADDASIPTY